MFPSDMLIKKGGSAVKTFSSPHRQGTLSVEEAYIQTLLALGGTEMSDLILKYYQTGSEFKKWYRLTRKEHLGKKEYIIKFFQDMKTNSFGQHLYNFISQKISYKILEKEWDKTQN